MKDSFVLSTQLCEEIISGFERRLQELGSPILNSPDIRRHILDQARSILDEIADSHQGVADDNHLGTMKSSFEIGAGRTIENIHPAESLRAAAVLFEAAFPFVEQAFSTAGAPDAASRSALVLHKVIMKRIASSAVYYVGSLLQKIHHSHRAERARLARDLHDRAAHAVGVAIQSLELHDVYVGRDVVKAHDKLYRAQEAMRQAMNIIRHFSLDLRTSVRPHELEQALTDYLTVSAASDILTSVRVTGDTAMLAEEVCEEVYIVLREAMRNSLVHSDTPRLDITVEITEPRLYARVSDTGRGFSIDDEKQSGKRGIGLSSMRERVQLLGGVLRLSSRPGHGATVEIFIPLYGVSR